MYFSIKYKLYFLSVSILYFISRITFLDSDVPLWDISYYQPIDEFYYSLGAFNLYHHGEYNFQHFSFINEPKYITNYLTELMVFISLKIFGNNYYGLRMASVFAGFFIIVLLFSILQLYQKKLQKDYSKRIFVLLLIYMIIDFSFLLSNRIIEPTIFRILAFMLVFFLSIKMTDNKMTLYKSFFLGILAFSSMGYVYITNLFIIPALGLYILVSSYWDKSEKIFLYILYYCLGVFLSFALFLIFYSIIFDDNYIKSFIDIYFIFSERINQPIENIMNIFHANIFKFNAPLLFLFLSSLPYFIYILIIKNNNITLLLTLFSLLFFLQTIFINDYFHRKLIFIFPLVLLILMVVYLNKASIYQKINEKKTYQIFTIIYLSFSFILTISNMGEKFQDFAFINYYTTFFIGFLSLVYFVYIILYRRKVFEWISLGAIWLLLVESYFNDYYYDNKWVFILPLVVVVSLVSYLTQKQVCLKIFKNFTFKMIIILSLVFSFIGIFMYHFEKNTSIMYIFHYILTLYVFILLVLSIYQIYLHKYLIYLFTFSLFFFNLIMDFTQIYSQPTYKYRDTMINLSTLIDNQYTIGLSHGYRLYNKSIPLMSVYVYNDNLDALEKDKKLLLKEVSYFYHIERFSDIEGNKDIINSFEINSEIFYNKIGVERYENK